jgi:hypothetical protein
MAATTGRDDNESADAHRISFFAPDRPVDGTTMFIRPASDESAVTVPDGD